MVHNRKRHDLVTTSLLEAAAEELSQRGPNASMADVADRAGVSRATLYNYFATRDELLEALTIAAINEAAQRIDQIDLDQLPVESAMEQISVALVSCGAQFAVTISPIREGSRTAGDVLIRPRLERLLSRGVREGRLTPELSLEVMMTLYYGLLMGAILATRDTGVTPVSVGTSVATVFLHGVSVG